MVDIHNTFDISIICITSKFLDISLKIVNSA
jgi:hypothetical protein